MRALNHQLTTGSAYLICMYRWPEFFPWMTIQGTGFALIGALLPDVDCHNSTVGRRLKVISVPIQLVLGHRGALHSLLAAAGLLYIASLLQFPWALSLTFGFLGHLVGDACTRSGVNFFWPLSHRYRVPFTPASNGVLEAITTWSLVLVAIYVVSVY